MHRVQAVTSHAAAFVQRWLRAPGRSAHHLFVPGNASNATTAPEPERIIARLLVAAGCGSARLPTCEQVLRYGRIKFYHRIAGSNEGWFLTDKLRF
jgi:type IV pilus biogenesis protein CpaD/CtpE